MARAALTTEPSKVYVGMLIATCVAMLVGIVTMALEAGEYDWVRKPQATAAPVLPPPPKSDSSSFAEPTKLAEAVKPAPLATAAAAVPAPLPPVAAAPVKADPPKPVDAK